MDLEHQYFYEVSRTRNMTKAAHNLFISQPALSVAIKKLEGRLGVELFDRQSNPLTLTEAGRLFLTETNKIRLAEHDFKQQLEDYHQVQVQTLYVGSSQYFNAYYLPAVLKEYRLVHPTVHFQIIEKNAQLLNKELYAGNVDIVVHCGNKAKQLSRQLVQKDRLLLAISKELISKHDFGVVSNYLSKQQSKQQGIAVLNKLPFISLSSSNNLAILVKQICDHLSFQPHTVLEGYQLETAFHMACCGIGATFITEQIRNFSPVQGLYFIDINIPAAIRSYYAYTRAESYHSKCLNDFISLLKNYNK